MIARRRMTESLSKVTRWLYKKGDSDFIFGNRAGPNEGLSFSAPSGQRLVLSPYNLKWVSYPLPTESYEKYIGGYVNIYNTTAPTGTHNRYDFTPYKQIVIEVESGSGVIGYGADPIEIPKDEDTHIINPPVKLEFNGAGKYIMNISKVNSENYICVGTTQYEYGSPRLIISNIYFK